jgi:NAD(P)-dependent dehydrogenase (short-subunit alcohol dehydrogenase family)
MSESKRVAVVTGASRGAGRGIAVALGEAGYVVYVTGRTEVEGGAPLPGTIYETADAVTKAGGQGVPVRVDHGNDDEIKALFDKVQAEQGRLDILVNNVAHIDDTLIEKGGFWEKPLSQANILNVGLRSQYVASWYAAPVMVKQNKGLIVFTSSFGSVCYMHGAAYGAQKAGVDKFAADMAVDFKEHNVATVSIWMGMLLTERSKKAIKEHPEIYGQLAEMAETPEYTGHIIAKMADDPDIMSLSGQTVIGAEIAPDRYGLTDAGGKKPISHRPFLGDPRVAHPAVIR